MLPLAPAIILAAAVAPGPGEAPLSVNDTLLAAEKAIVAGDSERAGELLARLDGRPGLDRAEANQVQFLLGLLAMAAKDYGEAARRFHRVLVDEPRNVRVRLELGRAYYLANDFDNAQRQFLLARAGKVPREVRLNIDRFLGAIRARRTFTFNLTFSVARDSNLNAGPATDTVTLYGLPFQLSQSAQANSGVGLGIQAGAEFAPRIGHKLRWRLGTQLFRAQYRDTQFDDMTLGLYSGPHLTVKKWDFNLTGAVSRRWYGDRVYSNGWAASADATWFLTGHFGLGLAVAANHTAYPQNPLQDGPGKAGTLSFFYTPGPATFMRGAVTIGRQDAAIDAYAFRSNQFSVNLTHDFPGGFTVGLAPSYTRLGYVAPLAAFGVVRTDHQLSGQVSVMNRKIDWGGLTPRVAYTYTHNQSTISLYQFNRSRLEFGVTRLF